MSSVLSKAGFLVHNFGFDPRKFGASAASILPFLKSYRSARKANSTGRPLELTPALFNGKALQCTLKRAVFR